MTLSTHTSHGHIILSVLLLQGNGGRAHSPKELGQVRAAVSKQKVPAPAEGAMGSLLDLVRQSLSRVLKARALKEAGAHGHPGQLHTMGSK